MSESPPAAHAPRLPLERWGRGLLAALQARADRTRVGRWAFEFLMFGLKQGWACVFGALMLGLLFVTGFVWPDGAPVARYDFLVIAAVAIQAAMLLLKLESWEEARVIFVFHVVGTIMELFKTSAGSWIYPEPGLLKIGAVPLFSGFMYAAVGSYIARIWRIFDIRFTRYPPVWSTVVLAAAIYVNFFSHHWLPDLRWALFAATALLFWRGRFHFTPDRKTRWMPILLGLFLVALFIWIAENVGTYSHAWLYPGQESGWRLVSLAKLGSWYLLMFISVVLVSLVHRPQAYAPEPELQPAT
ncbi:DUF817 domain-containing protein [Caulobacter sp. 17J65-9]|uniref:DUF817 domain-containing protein n=1 Tax=Caulobacter sp. 17J65-9 TaxID=2709382 RepID=UPI0013C8B353|nr:DUF817 domain-containing protein [Caulobacter sp. 17J65-9]NEX92449.1 DUF817 domain-containing protein [Caulobacter sp. 17J65-9]